MTAQDREALVELEAEVPGVVAWADEAERRVPAQRQEAA